MLRPSPHTNPVGSETSLQSIQKTSSSDINLSLTIDDDLPRWNALYFIHSEAKRLLGPLNDETCLAEDDFLSNSQSQSEVKYDKY